MIKKKDPKKHYLDVIEERKDEAEERSIEEIHQDLLLSLKEYEQYFLDEAIKSVKFDGNDSIKKITNALEDILRNDHNHYVQNTEKYKQFAPFRWTIDDALGRYTTDLIEKLTGGLSDQEVEMIVRSLFAFSQRKWELLKEGKISANKTDIDSFLEIVEKTPLGKEKSEPIKSLVQKIFQNPLYLQNLAVKEELKEDLEVSLIQLPSQEDVSEREWNDLEEIKKSLTNLIKKWSYEEFISQYFCFLDKKESRSIENVNLVLYKLLPLYGILGEKQEVLVEVYDLMERLAKIIKK